MPASLAHSRTTHQTAFSLSRLPHTRPVLLTQRKMIPASIPAMASHESIAPFTHARDGNGTDVSALSEQVDDRPVVVSLLKVAYSEPSEL
jgi:hypothetical protein